MCPRCGKPAPWAENPYRPFCSGRCRLIDLGNWASGRYRIPGKSVDEERLKGEEEADTEEKEKK